MSLCNLAKTVYNKWFQQFRKNGNNLYVATVVDYIQVLTQVDPYYQFSKNNTAGTRPSKEDLRLRLSNAMPNVPEIPRICMQPKKKCRALQNSSLESRIWRVKRFFLSLRHKAHVSIESQYNSHRQEKNQHVSTCEENMLLQHQLCRSHTTG